MLTVLGILFALLMLRVVTFAPEVFGWLLVCFGSFLTFLYLVAVFTQ